ncbi:aldo-keto reductase (AKR) [Fusarium circinatum]|uniref:Aldo-keto reductase (AKR) n=1 Tax=Fusarium circinatum TaxID=48490 RepID=A0A8H5UAI6_FUSCI|nr:aldo-keto reductase (AKR) [Fusarium circinatum]
MAPLKSVLVAGKTPIPHFIYGTAWKWDQTAESVMSALEAGFRAIDTAPQQSNYNETLVGQAIASWLHRRSVEEDKQPKVFLQSKFTLATGYEDGTKPFEDDDPPQVQVEKSLEQTCVRLCRGSAGQLPLDALLLHCPLETIEETMVYWRAMEIHVPKRVTYLGICNVSVSTFTELYARATIKPAIVQNDFRSTYGFDILLLEFCRARSVVYQAYAVLKGNMPLLESPIVRWLAHQKGVTEPQALYCFVLSSWDGYLCILNGTRLSQTMRQDLGVLRKVGKLDDYIIDGFREVMATEQADSCPAGVVQKEND